MASNAWVNALRLDTASGTAIGNSTTETIIFPNYTFPAYALENGRRFRITASGQYSTTGTPNLTFRVRWGGVGGTLVATSGVVVTGSGVTAAQWRVEVDVQTRSNGATGTFMAQGVAIVGSGTAPTVGSATGAPGIALMSAGGITTPATATVDLTAATALSITAEWGTANASNTLTGLTYAIELLN
jgi:hypothetical protein